MSTNNLRWDKIYIKFYSYIQMWESELTHFTYTLTRKAYHKNCDFIGILKQCACIETQKSHGFHQQTNYSNNNVSEMSINSIIFSPNQFRKEEKKIIEELITEIGNFMSPLVMMMFMMNDEALQNKRERIKTNPCFSIWLSICNKQTEEVEKKKKKTLNFHFMNDEFCVLSKVIWNAFALFPFDIEWKTLWMYVFVFCWTWNSIKFHILSEIFSFRNKVITPNNITQHWTFQNCCEVACGA